MKVLLNIFSLAAAWNPVALSTQSVHKAPMNPAKWEFLVLYRNLIESSNATTMLIFAGCQEKFVKWVNPRTACCNLAKTFLHCQSYLPSQFFWVNQQMHIAIWCRRSFRFFVGCCSIRDSSLTRRGSFNYCVRSFRCFFEPATYVGHF